MGLMSLEDTIKNLAKKRNNAHFMLVDGMSNLMTEKVKRCHSLDFHAFGLKWNFVIYSNCVKDYLSSYLCINDEKCSGSNWEVNGSCKLTVVSQTGSPDISKRHEMSLNSKYSGFGLDRFISQEVLKEKCLVNDKAVFCAEITGIIPKFLDVPRISRTIGTAECLKLIEVPKNNSKFTWKITKFSSFDGEHYSSYEFTVGPRRWYLEMYPKGCLEGKGNSFSLFLHASDFVSNVPAKATTAIFKLRVLDQLNRKHHEFKNGYRCITNSRKGFNKFLALDELYNPSNGFLVNDTIYIGVEFLFVFTQESL